MPVKTDFEQNAKKLVELAKDNFDIELDFSEKSLTYLDEIIGKRFKKEDENIGLAVLMFGSYLGETIIKNLGGKWIINKDIFKSGILIKDEKTKIQVFPFVRIIEKIYANYSILKYYKKVKKAIDKYEVYV